MKQVIQFGAGNIGRGFIGLLLEKAGYHVIFADINKDIITKINEDKSYTVNIMDINSSKESVTNISGILSDSYQLIEKFNDVDIVTTAVGPVVLPKIAKTIALGITQRKNNNNKNYLNIIACENSVNASLQLKSEVLKYLNEEEIQYLNEFIGFPNCSVDRIVPPTKSENIVDVVVEKYCEWNVEKSAFKGEIPNINGMTLVDNLTAYVERKLFTLNTGHALTAYLGYLKGHSTIDKSINDEKIHKIVKAAMIESGKGLIKKYDFNENEHLKYIDKIIERFKNVYLNDDVVRVGREPLRKLSESDRLIKPLLTARGYGYNTDNLILGIGASLHYKNESDEQSAKLQELINQKGVVNAVSEISNISDNELLIEISKAYENVKSVI